MTLSRRLALLLTTILVAAGLAAGIPAQAQAQANDAIAVNLEDGADLFEFAFDIVKVNGDVVDQTNTALAYAECEECRTIAVAFQIVLVYSDPEIVTPQNVAAAVNFECSSCETLASAYQFVYSVPEEFRFSTRAKIAMARIWLRVHRLIRSGRPLDEIQAEIDRLAGELRAIVRDEIDRFEDRRRREREREREREDRADENQQNEDTDLDEEEDVTTEETPTESTPTETDTAPTTTETTETPTTTTP